MPGVDDRRRTAVSERARLVERLLGPDGILPAYAHDLANVRRQTAELRVRNRKMLQQVRALQKKPTSSRGTAAR